MVPFSSRAPPAVSWSPTRSRTSLHPSTSDIKCRERKIIRHTRRLRSTRPLKDPLRRPEWTRWRKHYLFGLWHKQCKSRLSLLPPCTLTRESWRPWKLPASGKYRSDALHSISNFSVRSRFGSFLIRTHFGRIDCVECFAKPEILKSLTFSFFSI